MPGDEELRIVCGWCGTFVRGNPDPKARTSHGICATCEPKALEEARAAAETTRAKKAKASR